MTRRFSFIVLVVASAWHWCAMTALAQSPPDECFESAISQLRQAAQPQRDGSHLATLAALRQLRDASLQPFFEHILTIDSWPMQVHAALALAELAANRSVNAAYISRVGPEGQEAIIATGLDLGLVQADQLADMLASQNLAPMARLFALAELVSLKRDVDQKLLSKLTSSEDPHIAGLSAALLGQLGESKPFADFQDRFASFATPEQIEQAVWLFEAFRRYGLTASTPWLRALLARPDVSPDLRARAIHALLALEPAAGLQAWRKELGEKAGYQTRIRFGLLLLANAKTVPAETYDELRGEESEPLIEQIIIAGKATASGVDEVQQLCDLLELGHARTSEWAMTHVKDLPPDQAAKVYEFILDRALDPETQQADSPALAIEAATRTFEINPESLLTRLQNVEDDSPAQQTMMLGLLDASKATAEGYSKAVATASAIRRIGSGKADSIVLLFIAKHASSLSEPDTQQLGRLAAGGGRLPDALQMQAAWLYLKHTGRIEKALAQAFAGV
jgi:hypothetical protein